MKLLSFDKLVIKLNFVDTHQFLFKNAIPQSFSVTTGSRLNLDKGTRNLSLHAAIRARERTRGHKDALRSRGLPLLKFALNIDLEITSARSFYLYAS